MTLTERYHQLCAEIRACDPAITLVVVTKNQSSTAIEELFHAGCRDCGENRLQEALPKMEAAAHDLRWHMIGPLQSNKVRKAIGKFALIHSVDSLELASKISQCGEESGATTSLLLQVNVSGELTKQGFSVEAFHQAIEEILELPHIKVEGLMTMAPLGAAASEIRHCFSTLRKLRDEWGLQHLSMGMSQDYPIAIEEGATLLRIGSRLFL